ncbi:MAG: hypothetical protein A2172_03165 [Candidatus Woykebacteria bacterium RBG_13_40_15]|uniref:Uncharacterized protein n=1 Tax=Candidatus Woykebacteria bacterium RBG_13_40_15 TaxID=1802593 RepID=A0A1G1W5K8_9BACT|nr:MAG: hypothetical protein A2172_03165 [Candidatus Woykebacteria bacterium RBG_13_40_15]
MPEAPNDPLNNPTPPAGNPAVGGSVSNSTPTPPPLDPIAPAPVDPAPITPNPAPSAPDPVATQPTVPLAQETAPPSAPAIDPVSSPQAAPEPAATPPPTSTAPTTNPMVTSDQPATQGAPGEEVGPSWLRPTPEQGGQPQAEPQQAPDLPPLTDVPPPWQVPAENAPAETPQPIAEERHSGFPVAIFIILILGIIVAIGAWLFISGNLGFPFTG